MCAGGGFRSSLGSGAGGWGSEDTPLPAAAMPRGAATPSVAAGSAAGGGGGAKFGRVQFDVAPSPALTPSWRSTSWSKGAGGAGGPAGGKGEVRERSPDLRPEAEEERRIGATDDEFNEQASA